MKPLKVAARTGLALCAAFSVAASPAQAHHHHHPVHHHVVPHGNPTHYPVKTGKGNAATMVLTFHNVHTNENITIRRAKGEGLSAQVTWFMRDYRRGQTIKMDPKLFDLLGKLQGAIKQRHPAMNVEFEVVSSYRTPETNLSLREAGGTQAVHSQHMLGKAMDIRVPGLSTIELRDIATCLKVGGVGYYAENQFVHVDVGRVRYWPSHDYLATLKCKTPKAQMVAERAIARPRQG